MSRTNLIAALALSLFTAACGVDSEEAAPAHNPLTIETLDNVVRGSYQTADGEIDFAFTRTPMGMRAVLSNDDIKLVDVTVDGHGQDVRLLGMKQLMGPNGKPTIDMADRLDELASIPELRHLPELHDALIDSRLAPAWVGNDLLESTLGELGCRIVRDPQWSWSEAFADGE